jgi:hypothetical protein
MDADGGAGVGAAASEGEAAVADVLSGAVAGVPAGASIVTTLGGGAGLVAERARAADGVTTRRTGALSRPCRLATRAPGRLPLAAVTASRGIGVSTLGDPLGGVCVVQAGIATGSRGGAGVAASIVGWFEASASVGVADGLSNRTPDTAAIRTRVAIATLLARCVQSNRGSGADPVSSTVWSGRSHSSGTGVPGGPIRMSERSASASNSSSPSAASTN